MAMEPLPLGFGDFMDAIPFSSLWAFQDHHPQESMEELKQSLLVATMELEAAKEEACKKEQSIARLVDLVRQTARERDDAREQLHHLMLAAREQSKAAAAAPPPALVTSSVTDSDSLVSSPVDPFFDPVTSSDKHRKLSPPPPPPPPHQCPANAVFELLAKNKPLPQKGRLLQAVVEAGPLLQNLLVAGPLPRWRNPPPVQTLDALPLGGAKSYACAPPAAPLLGGNPAVLGYAGNACTKRPMAAAAVGFDTKRHRLN